ncbi:Increased rDNA silencing protein [Orbilia ellipsospora]|uniref:Increased rDNA silencing protein n=1 Tax=Orbilia ellipsospora TaxID=2528407 RepID=A0AAV9XND4_9PEZI
MTTSPFSAAAGFQEPFVTPQKRYSVVSLAHSTTSTNTSDKADAALRAATLSFSPPFTRQVSDEASVSASPPKTNGTALIAARAIGTGNSSPRSLPQLPSDRRGSLSRNSSFDLLASSPVHAGSLKAARLSVIGTPTGSATVSRARSIADLNSSFPTRTERTYSEDASFSTDGSLIAAKLSAAKRDSPTPTIHISNKNEMMQTPSLLAAGLAVSRSTTPAMLSSVQPERDQEPDILPPTGSVSEAKKRLLQQTDASEEVTIRGRRSLEGPMRSKISGTFHDSPPQSTLNISPLSAAKLAVQHSGRSAGASSVGPGPKTPKPRQPSPIKKEIRHDSTSEAVPASAPVAPPPKPAILKKPTIQNIKITKTAVAPLPVNVEAKRAPSSPKPAPKPAALKKIVTQVTGTPPPQPIKPLPRKTRPPTRTRSFKASVPDTSSPSPTLDNSKSSKPVVKAQAPPTPDEYVDKTAPPLPLPRRTVIVPAPPRPVEPPTPPIEPPTPVRRDPRLMGFNSVKLPPPVVDERPLEPVKQSPIISSIEPKKQALPVIPPKPKPTEPTTTPEVPIKKAKPEPLKPKTYVDSIVSRQPTSLYGMKERSGSASTLSPDSASQATPVSTIFKQPVPTKSTGALRPSFTGPDSTKPSHRRPSLNWREDLPYSFHGSEDYIRPSHTGEHHHARLASSLASSRAGSPVKSNPIPLPPRPSPGMRTTMRSPDKINDRDGSPPKKSHGILGKKHPNKHNEGARKRWREFVTEKERKRYEGLWAANRGLYLTEKMFDGIPDAQGRKLHLEGVCAVVVKDLWSRSRLPLDILEQIWDLVDRGPQPKFWLTRDEFIMGLWLIDQSLKGRKLPGKVQEGTWESVRRMGVVLKGYNELGLKKKEVKTRTS